MEFDPRESRMLVESAASGSAVAVDELLVRYLPLVRAHLRRQAGQLLSAKESTADLVQSVCREVLEQVRDDRFHYRGEAEFRSWLLSQARFKIHAKARHWGAKRREAAREELASRVPEELLGDEVTPSRDAVAAEDLERRQQAFARLSEEHREIIRLVRFEGLSHGEVAKRLGIDPALSRMRLSRALSRLARLVTED